jgi:PPOX class probable F420-dependent enzyme
MTTGSPDLETLAAAQYVLLTTTRRSGAPVPTAVWAAREGAELLVWTVTGSGKVKRIRHTPSVTVGVCDRRGTPLGDGVAATAGLLEGADAERVRTAIAGKYGLVGRLTMLGSRVRRGSAGTVGIALTLD